MGSGMAVTGRSFAFPHRDISSLSPCRRLRRSILLIVELEPSVKTHIIKSTPTAVRPGSQWIPA
jgi:hypothetical protein